MNIYEYNMNIIFIMKLLNIKNNIEKYLLYNIIDRIINGS